MRSLALAGSLLALWGSTAAAENDRVAVLILPRGDVDQNQCARIERDLRNMFDYAHEQKASIPQTRAIEPRYDVGRISKGEIETARRHFNGAQRALEGKDADEAREQLFRAKRFYNKAIPYSSDTALLRGIFFYDYLAYVAAGQEAEATDAYCAYVGLTRNLAGSAGPIEQFDPLADKCGETSVAGTAELRVTANEDGVHVMVDGRAVGIAGRSLAYVDPFLPAGPHLVEVRKVGFRRWGTLVHLKNGSSETLQGKLEKAKNRKDEYTPLASLVYSGPDASSEDYIADLFFQMAERFQVRVLVVGYVEAEADGTHQLRLFTFEDGGVESRAWKLPEGIDGYRPVLTAYWQARFGGALDPAEALPAPDRWAPTLFKVE